MAWTLLVVQFAVYPQLVYWRALYSDHPNAAERNNLYLDAALLGAWSAYLGFPVWISYNLVGSALLNAVINRGGVGMIWATLCSLAGAILWGLIGGFSFQPQTSELVTTLCVLGAMIYVSVVGYVVFKQTRRLSAARDALGKSEERYRLIAENAADLIAMVDPESHWLYGSPSYERVLGQDAVFLGGDAFSRAHPDDAQAARYAVRRVSVTGKARELLLRLADREGRVRQYKMRVQAVDPEATPAGQPHDRLLLASHDVTDLKESEERLLVAAHALEGMTEAILITSADGTVLTVNHAYSQLTGYARDDVLGRPERELRNGLQSNEFYDEVFLTVLRKGFWTGTAWGRRKNGAVYREWRSIRAVKDMNGAVSHYVMVFFEVESPGRNGSTGDAASPS